MNIVLDPGSTHDGRKHLCIELIDRCKDIKAPILKFQLFPNKPEFTAAGNIPLNYDWFGELVKHGWKRGVQVTASAFDQPAMDLLMRYEVPFVKFAYSQKDKINNIKGILAQGKKVCVSTDVMNLHTLPKDKNLIKLFCQPVYPTMWTTNFEGLFPMFDGVSDHSLGITESLAAYNHGAQWLEKHVTLPYKESKATPDGRFAISFEEAGELIAQIKKLEGKSARHTDRGKRVDRDEVPSGTEISESAF